MNKYDQIMFFLLNRLLQPFCISIKKNEEIVFLYKIQYDISKTKRMSSAHVIQLSKNINDAFTFLKMNYEDYKKQEFKNIFDFSNYLVYKCPYITKQFILSLEKGLGVPKEGHEELINQLNKFVKYVKLGHIILNEFNFVPIIMYANLKESIIRNFFNSPEVNKQFVDLKLQHLKDVELQDKFSGKNVVNWIHSLKSDPELCGIFTDSFVNYATARSPEKFPRYLIDHDKNIIKKEVITFYNHMFPKTEAYLDYKLSLTEKEEVII